MKVVFKIIAIIFILAVLGQLVVGNFFIAGFILAGIFGYLGFRSNKPDFKKTKSLKKVNRDISLVDRYPLLVGYIRSADKGVKIVKNMNHLLELELTGVGGTTKFTLTDKFDKFKVHWAINSPMFGFMSKVWEFDFPLDEFQAMETISNSLGDITNNAIDQKATEFESLHSNSSYRSEPSRTDLINRLMEIAYERSSIDGHSSLPKGLDGEKYLKDAYDFLASELMQIFRTNKALLRTLDEVYTNISEFNRE